MLCGNSLCGRYLPCPRCSSLLGSSQWLITLCPQLCQFKSPHCNSKQMTTSTFRVPYHVAWCVHWNHIMAFTVIPQLSKCTPLWTSWMLIAASENLKCNEKWRNLSQIFSPTLVSFITNTYLLGGTTLSKMDYKWIFPLSQIGINVSYLSLITKTLELTQTGVLAAVDGMQGMPCWQPTVSEASASCF